MPGRRTLVALSVDQITQNIINQLKALDATVSAEVGTPERKIIEATAEMIASAYVDFNVLNSATDINQMSGGTLDAYLGNFGFGRQQSTYATGIVTFSSGATPPATDITIARGTQVVATTQTGTLIYTTTQSVVLHSTDNPPAVDAPVACSTPGSIGNVAANAVTGFGSLGSTVSGITSVTNAAAMVGGADGEDDIAFRTRFQNTFLRNMGGTYDNFLAIAVSQSSVTKANVIGPISRFQEYIQVPAVLDVAQHTSTIVESEDGSGNPSFAVTSNAGFDASGTKFPTKATTAVSTNPYSKFTYGQQFYLTDGGLGASSTFYKPGVDFIFNVNPISAGSGSAWVINNSGTPDTQGFTLNAANHRPNVTFVNPYDPALAPSGNQTFQMGVTTALLEHCYISKSSRNDYGRGILNCVDIIVNGANPMSVSSNEALPTAFSNFSSDSADAGNFIYNANYTRALDGATPYGTPAISTPSRLLSMFWQPVLSLPNSFTITDVTGTYTYYLANFKPATYKTSTHYAVGNVVIPPTQNGYSYKCTVAGTTAVGLPGFPTSGTMTSGGATFITVNGTYYNDAAFTKPAHYALVKEITGYYGTTRARDGMEMFYLVGGVASNGAYIGGRELRNMTGDFFTIKNYTFDQNIADLQAIYDKQKPVTTDALVHAAYVRYFRPYVTIMYTPGSTSSVVNASIQSAVAAFFENSYYGTAIQLSDILQAIHNVPGVDNVRFTNDNPSSGNKVEETLVDGTAIGGGKFYQKDFFIQDNQLAASPTSTPVVITVRAQNTWSQP
jgi:uncharacterized phage protein gp47/JayE